MGITKWWRRKDGEIEEIADAAWPNLAVACERLRAKGLDEQWRAEVRRITEEWAAMKADAERKEFASARRKAWPARAARVRRAVRAMG